MSTEAELRVAFDETRWARKGTSFDQALAAPLLRAALEARVSWQKLQVAKEERRQQLRLRFGVGHR